MHFKCDFESNANGKNVKAMHIFQIELFPPIFKFNSSGKCQSFVMRFYEMWCMIMIEHIKSEMLQKEPFQLALWFKSYAFLKFKISWPWFDHILPTIHEKFMFLDFLETWEQDIQLSCWTKFHLKLVWWSNFEEQNFPFWAVEITGHLPFLETFDLTSKSSTLVFDMSNETCMDMNEASLTISHLQIHDWMHSWLWLTF